jgi:hypothetical protein
MDSLHPSPKCDARSLTAAVAARNDGAFAIVLAWLELGAAVWLLTFASFAARMFGLGMLRLARSGSGDSAP